LFPETLTRSDLTKVSDRRAVGANPAWDAIPAVLAKALREGISAIKITTVLTATTGMEVRI